MTEYICEVCEKHLDIANTCECCNSNLCSDCFSEIRLAEWLHYSSKKCKKCKRDCCSMCASTCYVCYDNGEDFGLLCFKCSKKKLKSVGCENHDSAEVCQAHIGEKCPECFAEENFAAKATVWNF